MYLYKIGQYNLWFSGPLSVEVDGHYTLIGVVSWGIGCADGAHYPGVYARVTQTMDWIKTTTGETFCKP